MNARQRIENRKLKKLFVKILTIVIIVFALICLISFFKKDSNDIQDSVLNTAKAADDPQIKPILKSTDKVELGIRTVTAYNSVPEQTDETPCIASDTTDICKRHELGECIIATNEFKNGTKLEIEKLGECSVADKTNSRYQYRIDVFMGKDVERAINFGKKNLRVYLITKTN